MFRGWLFQRSHICRINIVFVELQLLCCADRLSIGRITFFTFQSNLPASMHCDGALVKRDARGRVPRGQPLDEAELYGPDEHGGRR